MRVLVCRARADGEITASKLAALGHEAVLAPVLAAVALPVDLPPARPDAVLFTSHQAAEVLTDDQARHLAPCPAYAVGGRTAEAVRARGFRDVRVGQGDATSLADLIALTLPGPADLLYLAGHVRKPDIERAITRRGDRVAVLEVYDMMPAPEWDAEIRAQFESGLQACLHYSQRSAEFALAFADRSGVAEPFAALRHVCLSTDVAGPLRARGLAVIVVKKPDESEMLHTLRGEV